MKYRRTIFASATAIIVAFVLFSFVGVEVSFAIAWGMLAGVAVFSSQLILPDEPRADAPGVEVEPARRGSEIARMAWSINSRTGKAGMVITRRVQRVLAHRLSRLGFDVENPDEHPQIEALIGREVWSRLSARGTTRADIEQALAAIARLSPNKEKK